MFPELTIVVLLAGTAVFGILFGRRIFALAGLSPEKRTGHFKVRLKMLWEIGFCQKKMIGRKRERSSGWMHAIIFWGFLALLIRTVTLVGQGFHENFHLPFLGPDYFSGYLYILFKDIFEGAVFLAVLYALYRRYVLKVSRLCNTGHALFILLMEWVVILTDVWFETFKFRLIREAGNPFGLAVFESPGFGGEWDYTPFANLAGLVFSGIENPEMMFFLMQVMFALHIAAVIGFLCYLPVNKHFHVITALPNIFWGSVGYPHQKTPKINLEDEELWEKEEVGVKYLHQLTWKQGLDLYTCTECGRCQEVCPTFVTDKPLDLKTFNDSLKQSLYKENGSLAKRSFLLKKQEGVKSGEDKQKQRDSLDKSSPPVEIMDNLISQETLWACTTCRACEEVCPVSIEHVPRILGLRMGQTTQADQYPDELRKTFAGLERNSNPWGMPRDRRQDWAQKLGFELKLVGDRLETEYLLWVGCAGSFDERAQSVATSVAKILNLAKVDFSILGNREKCTGDIARRTGNEMLFQASALENIETLNHAAVKKIITFCPHCLNSLKNEYPDFGGNFEVIHHSQMIAELLKEGRIKPGRKIDGKTAFHDPCYLGRYNDIYDQPRQILGDTLREPLREMKYSRKESFCCGAGGARMWMEEKIGRKINVERIKQAAEIGAETLAVGCPFCLNMLSDALTSGEAPSIKKIKDIAEIVWDSVKPAQDEGEKANV